MNSSHQVFAKASVMLSAIAFLALAAAAQTSSVAPRITQPIDEGNLVTLKGNTHALARPQFDRGAVSDGLKLERLQLVLERSPQQVAALTSLLAQQQDKSSANYHKWLTPEQFGQLFGPATADIETVIGWLEQHGFTVTNVSKGRTVIEFTGTAGLVRNAFHTEIHNFDVNGEHHVANASNPQIPAALAPVVAGVASLHNFFPRSQMVRTGKQATVPFSPGKHVTHLTFGPGEYALGPADFAVIYNVQPVYTDNITGSGRTIATLGVSDIDASDVSDFDSVFGLPGGNWTVVHNGTDPGITNMGDQTESTLDNEWAGAIGYGATIKFVVSATTATTFGTDLSAEYVVDNNIADVMTVSYGACEAEETATYINLENSIAQQAAGEGITFTASSGDAGAEDCDNPATESVATGPVSVDLPGATPFTVSVGGTIFNEGGDDNLYWSTSTSAYPSALSYIPEDVWNESCKSGQSGCTTPSIYAGGGGVSESFALPSFQQGFSVPAAPNAFVGRGVPDVSLSAAGHDGYAVCLNGGCVPVGGEITLDIIGGTSASSPSFASIMSLVDQRTNSRQGQASTVLYALAKTETFASCNGSATPALPASSGCIFNDATVGNNAVPGETGYGTGTADYQAAVGWDPATGLGSVNVSNLVTKWTSSTGTTSYSVSAAAAAPSTVSPGSSATSTITVSSTDGFAGSITLSCSVVGTKSGDTGIPSCAVTGTNPITLSAGTTSATTTITVNTTKASALLHFPARIPAGGGSLALGSAIVLAWLFMFAAPARQRRWSTVAVAVLFVAMIGMAGCGGGGSSGGGGTGSTGTSADTYTVTVTATSGSTSQTTTFTVTVN
jgi:subtilase family serine protease